MKYGHIPTALSEREVKLLQLFADGQRVVECGALLGFSTLALAEVASKVISVDKHQGYGPSTLRAFMTNIEGYLDKVQPLVGDCIQMLPKLRTERYFLDLDGSYLTTHNALRAILAHDSLVAVHDFQRQRCDGVEQAIHATGWKVHTVIDTLAIIGR